MKDNSNITQELLESVERYHNHTMPEDERTAFETRLDQDATFRTQVEDIKSLILGIEEQALREQLDEFHKELPIQMDRIETDSKIRFLHFRKIAVAAIAIIALGSFWFFNRSSNERLYETYFKPDPGLPTTMSSSDNFAFFDAMVNYKQGDYQKAIAKWEVLHEKAPKNDTINYFLGVANLTEKNTDKAISFLQEAIAQKESVFNDDAHYYLGLAYLKKNDKEKAMKFLKLSTSENSKILLEKLE
ncbi:MAG: tetratricopeptide repeat protein [Gelidibacter sp.]